MIQIGDIQINIEGIITVVTSVFALLFAYLAWKNQVKERLSVRANYVLLNNNPILQLNSIAKSCLTISNIGYRQTTVTDIKLCIGNDKISVNCILDNKKINIPIAPGEVKYYEYDRNMLIDFISNSTYKQNSRICWAVYTNTKKCFKCKTNNRVSDVIDVNKGD